MSRERKGLGNGLEGRKEEKEDLMQLRLRRKKEEDAERHADIIAEELFN